MPTSSRTAAPVAGWNRELLRRLFVHQNGFAAITALATLKAAGVLDRLRGGPVAVTDLVDPGECQAAVAASLVAACGAGWLAPVAGPHLWPPSMRIDPDAAGLIDALIDAHSAISEAMAGRAWTDDVALERLIGCTPAIERARSAVRRRATLPDGRQELTTRLVEGLLATPLLPRLARSPDPDMARLVATALELPEREAASRRLISFFAPNYGLAGSYAEALFQLPRRVALGETIAPEDIVAMVDRPLNVTASAMAHRGYFRAADVLIARLFDEQPLTRQPRAILDVGCGDGSWLRELYQAIASSTVRGKCLRRHPLHLIAVDLEARALDIARERLHDLPVVCARGDIGQPEEIARVVEQETGMAMDEVLCIRAFVDHNRSLSKVGRRVDTMVEPNGEVYSLPSGHLADEAAVHDDWTSHYERWQTVTGRHGIFVIEAHVLDLTQVRAQMEVSHALALQYYHSLSGQSPLPYPRFHHVAVAAGFDLGEPRLFPRHLPTTSVHHFTVV